MTEEKIKELKGIMVTKGVSMANLAAEMGIHLHTLYRKFEQGSHFTRPEMDIIHKKLKLTDKQTMSIFFS